MRSRRAALATARALARAGASSSCPWSLFGKEFVEQLSELSPTGWASGSRSNRHRRSRSRSAAEGDGGRGCGAGLREKRQALAASRSWASTLEASIKLLDEQRAEKAKELEALG